MAQFKAKESASSSKHPVEINTNEVSMNNISPKQQNPEDLKRAMTFTTSKGINSPKTYVGNPSFTGNLMNLHNLPTMHTFVYVYSHKMVGG